ncbi:hypothetical protein [Lacipirellula limnantheis]|uniref:Uncharacterized protein n=1 Tax=Lacipirellula limnantheis TaxID=2528024 RepID=A0A517U5Z9_9BACT|nr:hypothetical protein [Lacipirellula limnantheis]QDT76058.1 hypothetical protein I41_53030 [Lacipirellula limnantheis]
MHVPRQFRLMTLLGTIAVAALAAGGARVWYEVKIAPQRADEAALAGREMRGVVARRSEASAWSGGGRRAVHLWFDEAVDFDAAASRLGELSAVASVQALGRQILPHAAAIQRGESDAVIDAWRRHPALREVLIDASVRGAPLGEVVELYDRDDLAMLQAALPGVKIVWMEVH